MELKKIKILSHGEGGEGVGFLNGKKVYVPHALPGDVVDVEVVEKKKSYIIAKLLKIVSYSKNRVEPQCKVSDWCGGCQFQSLKYDNQLKFKQEKVCNFLKNIADFDDKRLENIVEKIYGPNDIFRYRNKAQYPVRQTIDSVLTTGFFVENSHNICEHNDCLLSPKEFKPIVDCVLGFMQQEGLLAYDETTMQGDIRTILIRKALATGEILVCIVANIESIKNYGILVEKLKSFEGFKTLVLNVNKTHNNKIIGETTINLYGDGFITDILCGIKFKISAQSFYQVNPMVAEKIYYKVLEYASPKEDDEVWDICCGVGTITLFLAQKSRFVHGLEINEDAVVLAWKNAAINNIKNVDFVAAPAEDFMPRIEKLIGSIFVVDPPRKGIQLPVVESIVKANPQKVIYVSCNPKSFAVDVKMFEERGYFLKKLQPFDQFCHTSHVEVVGLLEK